MRGFTPPSEPLYGEDITVRGGPRVEVTVMVKTNTTVIKALYLTLFGNNRLNGHTQRAVKRKMEPGVKGQERGGVMNN